MKVAIPDVELVEALRKCGYPFPKIRRFQVGYIPPQQGGVQGHLIVQWSRQKRVQG
jgi:hypothetical protein